MRGLKVTQTCSGCGDSRPLTVRGRQIESPDTGGWRTLAAGAVEAVLCNHCVRAIVTNPTQAVTAAGRTP